MCVWGCMYMHADVYRRGQAFSAYCTHCEVKWVRLTGAWPVHTRGGGGQVVTTKREAISKLRNALTRSLLVHVPLVLLQRDFDVGQ